MELHALVLIVNQCTLYYMYIIEIKIKKSDEKVKKTDV
jgi:hypothetical protein